MDDTRASHAHADRRSQIIGTVLLCAAAVLWSLNGALIKSLHRDGQGLNGVTIAFYRSLIAGLFLLPLARGKFAGLRAGSVGRGAWRLIRPSAVAAIALFTLMTVCFVVATTKTEAANAIILQYTSTIWVFALSALILGEKTAVGEWPILGLAMAGIAIIFAGSAGTDLPGLAFALGAGFFYGLLTLMLRRLRDADAAAVTITNNFGAAFLLLPATLLVGDQTILGSDWLLLIVMGVIQFGLPYYLFSLALVRVPAHHAALVTMVEPVLTPLWAYLAVGEEVAGTTVLGGTLILAAVGLFVIHARRRYKREAPSVCTGRIGDGGGSLS